MCTLYFLNNILFSYQTNRPFKGFYDDVISLSFCVFPFTSTILFVLLFESQTYGRSRRLENLLNLVTNNFFRPKASINVTRLKSDILGASSSLDFRGFINVDRL